jgi:hypothetical protein
MQKYMPTRGEIRNINKNYQRGADIQKFVDRNILADRAKAAGATTFIGPDGIERLNLAGTGIKDPRTGATMLSMQAPSLTATAPTFRQFAGDVGRGLGSMIKGGFDFMTKGGITGALLQGAKDLFTQPIDTAKRIGYGAQDMMKGYDPFTKQGIGETQKIKTEPLPSFDLEAKMSAYEDPIKFYATTVNYTDEPKVTSEDQGRYTDPFMNKMFENRDYYKMNEMPAELLMPKQDLNKGVMTPKDVQIQKMFDNRMLEASNTLKDPYALLRGQNTQNMIFNKGGRVRGTGIMGALR